MKKEDIEKEFHAFQKVLEQEARVLTGLSIRIRLVVGTDSYATNDNRVIQVALNPWEAAFSWDIIKRILRFKFNHEIQHVLSTDSEEFVSGIEDCAEIFQAKGMCQNRAFQIAKWLVNAIEDGRIENIMVIMRKGLTKLRDWYRLKEYEETVVSPTDGLTAIELAICQMHSIACRGYLCKGFARHYKGQPVFDKVIDQIDNIKKAVTASTTRGMTDTCREMAESIADLINPSEETELSQLSDKSEEQIIILSNKNIEGLKKGKDWKEQLNKSSKIIAILEDTDDNQNDSHEGDSIIPDEIIDLRTRKPKSDESGVAESQGPSDNTSGKNTDCPQGTAKDTGSAADAETGSEASVDDFLNQKIDELDDALDRADKLANEMENREKTRKLQIIREINQNGLPERDKNKPNMENIMLDVKNRQKGSMPEYHPYNKQAWHLEDAPYDIIAKSVTVRKDIKKILASETEQEIGGLYEGEFDVDNISNLCLGSFDCFKRESVNKDEVHFDISILKDNSGSMGGVIKERCCKAMATLEECVKGIPGISLKISDYSNCKHGIIKDWDEQSGEFSYSWSYYENASTDGGQYDDISLDLFTSELVARPAATNKLLLLLTDGEPCVPREALEEILTRGRKAGVYILVFFIGYDAEHIACNKDRYEDIYGEGCCFAVPDTENIDNLADTFVELLKANVKL